MKTYKQISESIEPIDEAIVTFGKKLYPRDGNIVILAGGAGSGKGFVRSKLLGIEGKILDTDSIKELIIKSTKVRSMVKAETGVDIANLDLKNSKNVTLLHNIITNMKIGDSLTNNLLKSIFTSQIKPNIIFDVTLKDMTKFVNITHSFEQLGYDKKNIHIVWVINDFQTAVQQNANRKRVVSSVILKDTHKGAARTIKEILSMGDHLKSYNEIDKEIQEKIAQYTKT